MHSLDFFNNKNVLITGGAGAIGRNLSERLASSGVAKVIILDNLSSSYTWNIPDKKNILFIKGDICSEEDVLRAFRHKPQIIFHLAAFFANQNSIDNPFQCEKVNVHGLLRLLEMSIHSSNVEKFVYVNSEGGAYGKDCELPYTEDKISLDLSSPYYVSKLSGESYCRFYLNQYSLPISIVRLFNSYGPGEVPGPYRNVIPNFIFWAMQKKCLPLTGDENIARDFIYVDDVVEGMLRIASSDNSVGEAFNICTGKKTEIYKLAEMINIKLNNDAGIRKTELRKWDSRPVIIGDPGKSKKVLQFIPSTEINYGIDKTIEWFLKNKNNIFQSAGFYPGILPAINS